MGNVHGAARTIKENNILGGACGVLCPTDRLCEKACSTTEIDAPINIGRIQRAIMEDYFANGPPLFNKPAPNGKNVAVIGAGPAGLSCAAELAKAGVAVKVFEKFPAPGGIIRWGVPAKRFDTHFLEQELKDVQDLSVDFELSFRINGKRDIDRLLEDGYQAVFVGTGLWEPLSLFRDQAQAKRLYSSIDFLASLRSETWQTYAEQFIDKSVAVIGGGSVAIDCAESALLIGAADVFLVYRRSWQQMPAEAEEKVTAANAGIHFLLLNQPIELECDEQNNITGLMLQRTRLEPHDEEGRRRPVPVENSQWTLQVDCVIEAIGNKPSPEVAMWYQQAQAPSHGKGNSDIDETTGATTVSGVFIGGDIMRGPSLVVEAVQDGKNAANAILKYLNEVR
jgi:NADPH-dependent glutamate synthase beta subunit-like oxidoreductase